MRQVGVYFAMLTLAFGQMFYFLETRRCANYTGERERLAGRPASPHVLGLTFSVEHRSLRLHRDRFISSRFFDARLIVRSPFGAVLRAILENPERALAVGHDVFRYKLVAFTIAAAYAGWRGACSESSKATCRPKCSRSTRPVEIIVMK